MGESVAGAPGRRRQRLGGFTLLRRLGRGSMGAVFLARQDSLDRLVALKVLAPRLARNESYVRRFLREARAAASLNHKSIVSAIDVGEADGFRYFVMEYAQGPTVADLLRERGPLPEDRAVEVILQVSAALDHAHAAGFVHRDIKPANIIVTADGTAKLCDLGLAKEVEGGSGDTEGGQTLGTPDYISPEQARGDAAIDIRSDVYSLGATLFHMLVGEPPFPGPNPAVVMARHLTEPVPDPRSRRPEIRPATAAVVRRMLAKSREQRPQSPAEVTAALLAAREGSAPKPWPVLRSRRPRGRRRRR